VCCAACHTLQDISRRLVSNTVEGLGCNSPHIHSFTYSQPLSSLTVVVYNGVKRDVLYFDEGVAALCAPHTKAALIGHRTKKYMNNKIATKQIIHSFNGFEDDDEVKTVEIDGVTYEADPDDPTKAKEVDGEKVKYEKKDPKPADPPKPDDLPDISKMSTEEVAALNPEIKKLLEEKAEREEADRKAADDKKKEEGKHEELLKERDTEIEDLKKKLGKKETILEKYVGSVKQVLEQVKGDIPKDNLGLIPDNFSPREQLEYITKNAKLLGVKVGTGSGGGVDPNDTDPNATDLQKYQTEFEELQKKENKTQADFTRMHDLGKLIKDERAKANDS
jgi:hypothetical protein